MPVEQVIVGAMRVFRADVPDACDAFERPTRVRIGVEFEANVATAQATYYSVESWLFGRDATQTSKPPERARRSRARTAARRGRRPRPARSSARTAARSSTTAASTGSSSISLVSLDERPPTLTTEVPERGTDLPTYAQPAMSTTAAAVQRDSAVGSPRLAARLELIYAELNAAWATNELAPSAASSPTGCSTTSSTGSTPTSARASQPAHDMRITRTSSRR